jgi:hypothetical protein
VGSRESGLAVTIETVCVGAVALLGERIVAIRGCSGPMKRIWTPRARDRGVRFHCSRPLWANDATSGTTGSAPNDPASWTARGTFCSVREGLLAQQLHSESTGEIRTRSPDDPDGPTVVVKLQVSKGAEPRFYTFLLPFSYLILVQCPTETNKHDRLSA